MRNNLDKQYQQLLQDIIDNGVEKGDRTGTGTTSVFGRQIRHKMSEGFPLLTTKKMVWKSVVTELLWFLKGDTNIKFLVDNGCNIWNGDAYKNYLEETQHEASYTKEGFINLIKTDKDWANVWGELGPIYGKQWRNWTERSFTDILNRKISYYGNTEAANETAYEEYKNSSIDQIQNLISELKTTPDSRRLMVNAWNVGELGQMVLPPCHYGFQLYTRELTLKERFKIAGNQYPPGGLPNQAIHFMNEKGIPKRAISLMWNQRSVDTFLGLPFNIASYGLLLEIIAKEVNMVPDELIGNLGDVHLYLNHIEQAREQIGRKYTSEERLELLKKAMGDKPFSTAVEELMPFGGGLSEYYDIYKIPYQTKEPFELPKLNINTEFWQTESGECGVGLLNTNLKGFEISDFQIENYQSHSAIKAPLSN